MREWLTLGCALTLAGVFFFVLQAVSGGALAAADAQALSTLRELRGPALNRFFLELTALGSVTVLTLLSVLVVTVLLLERRYRSAFQLLLASALTAGITQALKVVAARPRPPVAFQLELAAGFSFPSGHSSSGAAIYLTLALLLFPRLTRRPARAAVLGAAGALILLLGFSRAYLSVHYPTDVLGGLCLGTGIALLTHLSLNPRSAWHLRRRN